MRRLIVLSALLCALPAIPASAQDSSSREISPGQLGVVATTPSRIPSSRREMNRGRESNFRVNMTPTQTLDYARTALRNGGFQCQVVDAVFITRTEEGAPLVEVDCAEGGGLVIADTSPIQATDCLDLPPEDACRLPANVATVAAERRSARP